jgi:hypothetical protein
MSGCVRVFRVVRALAHACASEAVAVGAGLGQLAIGRGGRIRRIEPPAIGADGIVLATAQAADASARVIQALKYLSGGLRPGVLADAGLLMGIALISGGGSFLRLLWAWLGAGGSSGVRSSSSSREGREPSGTRPSPIRVLSVGESSGPWE